MKSNLSTRDRRPDAFVLVSPSASSLEYNTFNASIIALRLPQTACFDSGRAVQRVFERFFNCKALSTSQSRSVST